MHPDDNARDDQSPAMGVANGLLLILPFWTLGAALLYWATH